MAAPIAKIASTAKTAAKKAAAEAAKKKAAKAAKKKVLTETERASRLFSSKTSEAPGVIRDVPPAGKQSASNVFDGKERQSAKDRVLDYMKSKSPSYQKMSKFQDIRQMMAEPKMRRKARGLAKDQMVDEYVDRIMQDIKKGPKIIVEE